MTGPSGHWVRAKGASLKATDQPIDTSTAAGKRFLDMLGVFAEFETNLRRERQLEGIAKAKAAAVYKVRPASIDEARIQKPEPTLLRRGMCLTRFWRGERRRTESWDKVMEIDKVATALDALHRAVGDLVEAHRLWETGIRDMGDWHAAITAVALADAAFEAAVLANAPIAGDGDRDREIKRSTQSSECEPWTPTACLADRW
jgi:hypothetical protein